MEDFNYSMNTNCPHELMCAIALQLMKINNRLYPKLDSMPMADDEEMGRLKAVYHSLANTQDELMDYIRKSDMGGTVGRSSFFK